MQGVTVVDHPLVQHKLTLMRDKTRSTKGFRQLLNEIGMLLLYEVTRDLPIEMVEIETPLTRMQAPQLAGKKLVLAARGTGRHRQFPGHASGRADLDRRHRREAGRARLHRAGPW
jgi:hypothetical protein